MERHFVVSAIIIKDQKVLLLNHRKLGFWLFPGGHIDPNENPEIAVVRETKEETGLDVEIIQNKDDSLTDERAQVMNNPYIILNEVIKPGKHFHFDLLYLCKLKNSHDDIVLSDREISEARFVGLEDLDQIDLIPNVRKLVVKVLKDNNLK